MQFSQNNKKDHSAPFNAEKSTSMDKTFGRKKNKVKILKKSKYVSFLLLMDPFFKDFHPFFQMWLLTGRLAVVILWDPFLPKGGSCAFLFVEIQFAFCFYLQNGFDQSFTRNIFTPL